MAETLQPQSVSPVELRYAGVGFRFRLDARGRHWLALDAPQFAGVEIELHPDGTVVLYAQPPEAFDVVTKAGRTGQLHTSVVVARRDAHSTQGMQGAPHAPTKRGE